MEVTLTAAANVRIMKGSDFNSYRRGGRHRYIGGLVRRSPYRAAVPSSGQWYVIVDMQGLRGSTNAAVNIIPGEALRPLPPAREARPELAEIAANLAEAYDVEADYDVFLSHAGEDKDAIVRPLAAALQERGVSVWYDETELRVGDSLRRKIDAGIARSRFGVVVLSPSFFDKGWPEYELDGLVTMSVTGKQVLLPIWHNVTKDEVVSYSPSLADKVALTTASMTIDAMADELHAVIAEGLSS